MSNHDCEPPPSAGGPFLEAGHGQLVIATLLRGDGVTGVDTHIRQLRRYLAGRGTASTVITPFSWGLPLTYPVFGLRPAVNLCSKAAGVAWYLHWHEVFLRRALRRHLAGAGECVVYAQDPLAARAALGTRKGRHQRVILAVHFRVSLADEWAGKELISRDGKVYQAIRRAEREVIPRADGLVYVSRWARQALLSWLPEAAAVPAAVIGNFTAALPTRLSQEPAGDLVTVGNLDLVKNHRFLLDVLAEAKRAGVTLTLDIFGEGPCRKDLERQAQRLGMAGQVRLRGYQPDVREFLPGYRAYVHASYSESSSLAIMEAMAAGLPIVAGNIGPIAELCNDGSEARFWPLDDVPRAAAELTGLLGCEPERLKAVQAARDRFRRDYDADVVAPRLASFLLRA